LKANKYAGKYAIVTGASSGIGKAISMELAKKQVNLILVARRIERLNAIKKDLENNYKIDVIVKSYDLSDIKNCHLLHEETKEYDPEIIINNAGFGLVGLFQEIPLDKELEMLRLNLESVHVMTKLFVSSMNHGIIMNVSSMAGLLPTPLMAAYSASKAYVLNFSRAVNHELHEQKKNIKIMVLCPGPVDTEFAGVANVKQSMKGMSASECAKIAVKGIERGRGLVVPGCLMKLTQFMVKLLPVKLILFFSYRFQKSKR